jgi:LPXTG-site transpeptidase (sortase) family protein
MLPIRKILLVLIRLLVLLLVLVLGVALGAYYHTELVVLWRGIMPQAADLIAEPTAVPSVNPATDSFITLPSLDAPLPLIYSATLDEPRLQELLKEGAVVLPLGIAFGEAGNIVVTAHSSGTESFGPYRFAFAKLSELNEGDEYSISTPTATYRYKVYKKEIVWPHEVNKLPQDDRSTVTLVTCWPLWTNFKRLLVHTELTSIDYNI